MKNAGEHAQRLKQLLKQLEDQVTVPEMPQRSPVEHLVYAFLVWESSRRQADQVFPKLIKAVVDLNELRVNDPEETVEVLGAKYPRAEERAQRIKRVLNGIYVREHEVDLGGLQSKPKREARAYLEELEGMVPFVAASVCLFGLNAHAMPVDESLSQRLRKDGVIAEDATLEQAQAFLEHNVRADEGREVFHRLRAYVERPIKAELDGKAEVGTKKTGSKSAAGAGSRSKKASTAKKTKSKTTKKKGSGGRVTRSGGKSASAGGGSKSGGGGRTTKKKAARRGSSSSGSRSK